VESRKAAKLCWVSDICTAEFFERLDSPSALFLGNEKVERVRLYGFVVSSGLVVDDGSGCIIVRSFDSSLNIDVGKPVLVIGRPRKQNNEVYVLSEVVKEVDSAWLSWASLLRPKMVGSSKQINVLDLVRSLDSGDGADFDVIAAKVGEEKVVSLLAAGELFEIRPGKIKVLE